MLEIVVVDGEEVVTTESIKQSTLIGAEASKMRIVFPLRSFSVTPSCSTTLPG